MNKKTKIGLATVATVIFFAYIVPGVLSNPYWLWGLRIKQEPAASESLSIYHLTFVKGDAVLGQQYITGTNLSVRFWGVGKKSIIFYNEAQETRAVVIFDPSGSGEDVFRVVENTGLGTGP